MPSPSPATTTRPRLSRTARRRRRGRRVARVLLVGVLALLVGGTTFTGGLLAAPADFSQDILPEPKPVLLLSDDGTQFASIQPTERRVPVPAAEIPLAMREAMISAEDSRFLEHEGVDPIATVRAAWNDVRGGRTQGGSTLTQQYVKNAYVGSDRTLLRKVREAALAVRLERQKSKDEILTDYLNALYLGNGAYGVQAASRYYFGVDVQDLALDLTPGRGEPRSQTLELARAALLAGIAPAPSAWNPVRDMATAKIRQRYVLNQMVINGYISPAQASEAFGRGVEPVRETPPVQPTNAPEFADLVNAQLKSRFETDEDVLFRGGLRVRTTLDTDLQEAVSRAAREVLPDADDPQAAVVAVDIRNGDIKAMTTLRRYPQKGDRPATDGYQRGGFNLATNAFRSSGSTIKPFILATALEQGRSLGEVRRGPQCRPYRDTRETAQYCNSDGGSNGSFTLRNALVRSVNTVFVPLADEVGRDSVRDVMLGAGVRALDPDGEDGPRRALDTQPESFGLGTTALVTPLSMANAYGTLMNHGVAVPPRTYTEIRTSDVPGAAGSVVMRAPDKPEGTRVLKADVADRVTEVMREVVTRGTGREAARDFPVFGKTGTTNDSRDAWWIGCARSPQNICIAVWMGYEDSNGCAGVVASRACGGMLDVNGVPQVYGGTLPARIFARTFDVLREIQRARTAPAPAPAPEPEEVAEVERQPEEVAPRRRRRSTAPEPAPAPASDRPAAPAPAPQEPAPPQEQPPAEEQPAPPPEEPPPPPQEPPAEEPPPSEPGPGPIFPPG